MLDDHGHWCNEFEALKNIAINFVSNLFTKEDMNSTIFPLISRFPSLCSSNMSFIQKLFVYLEIKQVIFNMGTLKMLRVDGFHDMLFESQ